MNSDFCENWNSGKFGPNTEICSDFYEIWIQNKSKMLIMNIILAIV